MNTIELMATTAFGLEAIVEREVQKLGYSETKVEDGRVRYRGDLSAICRSNLWLRSADRVLLVIDEFHCPNFDALFDRTKALEWENWLPVNAKFPVYAKSVKSMLTATPSVQRAVKKAVVERLKEKYNRIWFEEDGAEYAIEVSLLNDRATLTIDTSGEGLHKRGYRQMTTEAPLKETLAAAMIQLSYWNRDRPLVDPFCGSGTIPIEAALIARHMPPGGDRSFAAESWPQVPMKLWTETRKEARDLRQKPLEQAIIATDIDPQVLRLARKHASDAGVATDIHFERKRFEEFREYREYGCLIANPPYGERMGDRETVDRLCEDFGEIMQMHPTWSFYCLTSLPVFERLAGRRADRRRKLYNGRIECTYYQFQGPRPPREAELAAAEAEASIPSPPLDFKPLIPPTRGPLAGQSIDTLQYSPEAAVRTVDDSAHRESQSVKPARESHSGLLPNISTMSDLPPALINRMKTLDFKPRRAPLRGPFASPTTAEPMAVGPASVVVQPSTGGAADPSICPPTISPIPLPPADFKPLKPPLRGPLAQPSAGTETTDSAMHQVPASLDSRFAESPDARIATRVEPLEDTKLPIRIPPVFHTDAAPAVPRVTPPTVQEHRALTSIEPVRPHGVSLVELANRAGGLNPGSDATQVGSEHASTAPSVTIIEIAEGVG